MSLASAPVAIRSAFRTGGLAGVLVRPSRHAPSGVVLVCAFRSPMRAGAYARRWATRLAVSVVVRPFPRPGRELLYAVSVPVAGAIPFPGVASLPAGDPLVASAWPLAGVRSVPSVARSVRLALL